MRSSIVTLLAVVILSGAARGDEASALKLIEQLKGTVRRDDKQNDKPVVAVRLRLTKVTDDDLKELKAFPQLADLNLSDTKVTDAGLKELKELKQLATLNLSATQITDAGLKDLQDFKQLQSLSLYNNPQLTDAAVKDFKESLPGCKVNR
jgi:hypothetical protein